MQLTKSCKIHYSQFKRDNGEHTWKLDRNTGLPIQLLKIVLMTALGHSPTLLQSEQCQCPAPITAVTPVGKLFIWCQKFQILQKTWCHRYEWAFQPELAGSSLITRKRWAHSWDWVKWGDWRRSKWRRLFMGYVPESLPWAFLSGERPDPTLHDDMCSPITAPLHHIIMHYPLTLRIPSQLQLLRLAMQKN